MGRTDAVAHEIEKARIDDVFRRECGGGARRPVAQREHASIRILVRLWITRIDRMDTDIVPADSREQRALSGDRPSFDMPLEKIGIRVNELRGRLVTTIRGEARSARKGSDVGGEGRRRVAAV